MIIHRLVCVVFVGHQPDREDQGGYHTEDDVPVIGEGSCRRGADEEAKEVDELHGLSLSPKADLVQDEEVYYLLHCIRRYHGHHKICMGARP